MLRLVGLRRSLCALGVFVVAGCSAGGRSATAENPVVPFVSHNELTRHMGSSGKIQHVVIIVQENRSFDNMFYGYPKADTATFGYDHVGDKIQLQPVSLKTTYEIDHSHYAMFAACNGPPHVLPGTQCVMNGFDKEFSSGGPQNPQYVYVPHSESKPYFDMANEGVLADRMFQSHVDESFVSHQYIIAAQAGQAVDLPYGYWGCDGGKSDKVSTLNAQRQLSGTETACWDYTTLGDELDAAGLSWRFYTSKVNSNGGEWSGYQAIRHIRYGADWHRDVITPQTKFIKDVQRGVLANVTWVTPICYNSDHVNCGGGTGPQWVASLVNAVGESSFWNSTAIFIMWDDWGGLYDHVPPPFVDYDGLGFRVPLVILSAYSKQNFVSHVQYEHGSILKFAEDQFGLGRLAASDTRANSPEKDCFNFNKPPHAFVPIQTGKYDLNFFMHQPPDPRPPDEE